MLLEACICKCMTICKTCHFVCDYSINIQFSTCVNKTLIFSIFWGREEIRDGFLKKKTNQKTDTCFPRECLAPFMYGRSIWEIEVQIWSWCEYHFLHWTSIVQFPHCGSSSYCIAFACSWAVFFHIICLVFYSRSGDRVLKRGHRCDDKKKPQCLNS